MLIEFEKNLIVANKHLIESGDWDMFFHEIWEHTGDPEMCSDIFQFCYRSVPNLIDKLIDIPIGAFAFTNVDNLIIPEHISEIRYAAFEEANIGSLTIEDVDLINEYAFSNSTINILTLPISPIEFISLKGHNSFFNASINILRVPENLKEDYYRIIVEECHGSIGKIETY